MILFERRASVILYRLLATRRDPRPFLLPVNVCAIVSRTFEAAGQPFEYIDIDDETLDIDVPACRERLRRGECAGVLYVRTYGHEWNLSAPFATLRNAQHDLLLIDDKCLCRPDCDDVRREEYADITLYSTGRAKFADVGEGGFAHCPDDLHLSFARGPAFLDSRSPDHSWDAHRLRTLEAIRAVEPLKRSINEIYTRMLPAGIQLPAERQQWRFNIRVENPETIVSAISGAGLYASRHYAPASSSGVYPVATRLHSKLVNLFNDRHYDPQRARRTAEVILNHLDA